VHFCGYFSILGSGMAWGFALPGPGLYQKTSQKQKSQEDANENKQLFHTNALVLVSSKAFSPETKLKL